MFCFTEYQSLPKECIPSTSRSLSSEFEDDSRIDDSIQINEISSSDSNESRSNSIHRVVLPRLKKSSTILKKVNDACQQSATQRKITRSSIASNVRITRSAGVEKRIPSSLSRNLKPKVAVIIQKQTTSNAPNTRNHKENISILRKVPVKALVNSAIVTPSRLRHSHIPQPDNKPLNRRTLRSQNVLTKETVNKAIHQTASNPSPVNTIIQQIGHVVAKAYPISTRANLKTNANHATNNVKQLVCKKPPKRLINAESVQIIKSNHSNKLQKSSESLCQVATRPSTLRFKVVVAKKSVVEQLKNGAQPSVITRRMRLQQ